MKSLNVEILMGHDIGLADSYYRPSEQELLESAKRLYFTIPKISAKVSEKTLT